MKPAQRTDVFTAMKFTSVGKLVLNLVPYLLLMCKWIRHAMASRYCNAKMYLSSRMFTVDTLYPAVLHAYIGTPFPCQRLYDLETCRKITDCEVWSFNGSISFPFPMNICTRKGENPACSRIGIPDVCRQFSYCDVDSQNSCIQCANPPCEGTWIWYLPVIH